MIGTILLVFAFVFFCIGTFQGAGAATPWYTRFNFVSAGLAAWSLAVLLGRGVLH
jgi:hypothetical protein